jgi:hypothetical protein
VRQVWLAQQFGHNSITLAVFVAQHNQAHARARIDFTGDEIGDGPKSVAGHRRTHAPDTG